MKALRLLGLALAALVAVGVQAVQAQTIPCAYIGSNLPGLRYEADYLGQNCNAGRGTVDTGAVISATLATPQTLTSSDITNYDGKGVICTYSQSAESGEPSVTFNIQSKDAASGTYQTLVTSSAILGNTSGSIEVYPGIATSSLPAGISVTASLALPRVFRVNAIIAANGQTAPGTTFTIGCNIVQ